MAIFKVILKNVFNIPLNNLRRNKKFLEITKKCESKSDQDEFCEERDEDAMHIEDFPQSIDHVRVPNVIMLGKTGAGKSFFGSGLFGAEDPDKGISHYGIYI